MTITMAGWRWMATFLGPKRWIPSQVWFSRLIFTTAIVASRWNFSKTEQFLSFWMTSKPALIVTCLTIFDSRWICPSISAKIIESHPKKQTTWYSIHLIFFGIHEHTPILKDDSLSFRFTGTKKSQNQGDVGVLFSCRVDLAYHLGGEFGEPRLGLPWRQRNKAIRFMWLVQDGPPTRCNLGYISYN